MCIYVCVYTYIYVCKKLIAINESSCSSDAFFAGFTNKKYHFDVFDMQFRGSSPDLDKIME